MRDQGIFYVAQSNAWNTQNLWTRTVKGFDKMSMLQGRYLTTILDNCSAHAIDYSSFSNLKAVFLPRI